MGAEAVLAALPTAITERALSHPVEFLQCKTLQSVSIFVMVLGFIGAVSCLGMLVLHSMSLGGFGPTKLVKLFLVLGWVTFVVAFSIMIATALVIYNNTWTCNNPVSPTLKLADSFDFHYGLNLAIIGDLLSILAAAMVVCNVSAKKTGPTAV